MPTNDQTLELLASLNNLSSRLASGTDANAESEALRLSKALTLSLQDPVDVAIDLAFSPFIPISARVAIDLDLFTHIRDNGPVSVADLAKFSGAEESLIARILRPLAAANFVKEVDEGVWDETPLTRAMAIKEIAAGHRMVGEFIVGAVSKAPKFLRETNYRFPTSPSDGLMQYAYQTKLSVFGLLATMPQMNRDFNLFMGSTMGARNYWVDWYPVEERILDGYDSKDCLLVDVAGGKGHDVQAFQEKFPGKGRLVLQDLPQVLNNLNDEELDTTIERMVYDFFTEQPIKNARVYFYHHILHDWSDEHCLRILAPVREAMKPGYSKLLLHDLVLPEKGATPFQANYDMVMMAFNSGIERTGKQWTDLLEKAGFVVTKIWHPENDADGLVEAMIKE